MEQLLSGLVAGGPVVASSLTEVDEEEAVQVEGVAAADAFFLVRVGLTGRGGRSLLRFFTKNKTDCEDLLNCF